VLANSSGSVAYSKEIQDNKNYLTGVSFSPTGNVSIMYGKENSLTAAFPMWA